MAKKKISKILLAFVCIIALTAGTIISCAINTEANLPFDQIPKIDSSSNNASSTDKTDDSSSEKPDSSSEKNDSSSGEKSDSSSGDKTDISSGALDVDIIKNNELSIHFIELGNKYTGDCTFIKVGDVEILVDAGSRADSVTPIYNYITPYITDGILEYVIVTHAHQDHYAGFATGENTPSLLDKLNVKTLIHFSKTNQKDTATLYNNFKRELSETQTKKGTQVFDALQCYNQEVEGAQRVYDISPNIELEILYQEYYEKKASSENDYSVCFVLNQTVSENQTKRYLFTGDLEANGEKSLVAKNSLSQVELYKAGHHGSKTSSSEQLLKVIQPKIVCVCCCAGSSEYTTANENQFPTQAFVDRVAPYTDKVFVTTLCVDYKNGIFESFNGNIVITTDKDTKETKIMCSNNAVLLKDSLWFLTNRTTPKAWQT